MISVWQFEFKNATMLLAQKPVNRTNLRILQVVCCPTSHPPTVLLQSSPISFYFLLFSCQSSILFTYSSFPQPSLSFCLYAFKEIGIYWQVMFCHSTTYSSPHPTVQLNTPESYGAEHCYDLPRGTSLPSTGLSYASIHFLSNYIEIEKQNFFPRYSKK